MVQINPFETAKWITPNDETCQSPVIRRVFSVEEITQTILYVTGLGYFEARLNGQPVTEDLLIPLASDYERRDNYHTYYYPIYDTFTHRIYYCKYDVTHLLKTGENTLEIQLGNGWYRQTERICEGKTHFGTKLKAIYSLQMQETSIDSDGTEQWYASEILENQIFLGEVQDARITEQEPVLRSVEILCAPESILTEQTAPADKVIRTLKPKCLYKDAERSLWDAGENISGVVRVFAKGKPGEAINLKFAEQIAGNELNFDTACGATYTCASGKKQIMEDTFICGNEARWFAPKFVWHAFRFFEMTGPGVDPEVLVIHSDTPVNSTFESDNEGWNYLYDAFLRTQLDNMHGGFPSDCPHRDRLGYTGDGQAASKGAMLLLDSKEFYKKWIQDILDCQDVKGGHVQHTAPFMGGGGGPGGWGCAIAIVPWHYYQIFGETEMLEKCYPAIQKWVGYLEKRCENGLLVREEEGGWCLGEWCTPEKNELPIPFVNTCFFIHTLEILRRMTTILGRPVEEREQYQAKMNAMRNALRENYYNPETHEYCNNYQGAHAYAAWVGIADDTMIAAMAEKYREARRFDTGFLGTPILCDVLFAHGYGDVVNSIMENDVKGTFLYQKRLGATTLWEYWHGGSNNHPMFGGCVTGAVNYLLGIRPADDLATYQNVCIAPVTPTGMNHASGSITTPWGEIRSAWKRKGKQITFQISIPDGITAMFRYADMEKTLTQGDWEIIF